MSSAYSLDDLLAALGETVSVEGEKDNRFYGIASLSDAQTGDLAFLGNSKYRNQVPTTRASVILLPDDYAGTPRTGQTYVRVAQPSLALARFCRLLENRMWPLPEPGIDASAVVAADAVVADSAYVGAQAYIGKGAVIGAGTVVQAQAYVGQGVTIGEDCRIGTRTSILDFCRIGNRVRIQTGAVIGSDGFGFEVGPEGVERIPQIGIVVLEDDVDIGANTTIDRARFGQTKIGTGSKIDNLVQIAHNVQIGAYCIVVAQAGISGSVVIEDQVIIGGQVGMVGHIHIGKGSKIGAQAGVNASLEAGSYVRGTPAEPFLLAQRMHALSRRLPDLFKRVANIEQWVKDQSGEGA